jgi:hypothetical protein
MRIPHRAIQENPRKTKEIQIKRLGFPWIRLAETGLFNGLQPKKIKIFPASKLRCNMPQTHASHWPISECPSAGLDPMSEQRIARVRINAKKMQRNFTGEQIAARLIS